MIGCRASDCQAPALSANRPGASPVRPLPGRVIVRATSPSCTAEAGRRPALLSPASCSCASMSCSAITSTMTSFADGGALPSHCPRPCQWA